MMAKQDVFTLRLGGIEGVVDPVELTFARGAVNLLVGRNEAGKTTCTKGLVRAGGDSKVPLSVSDGAEEGFLELVDGSQGGSTLTLRIGERVTVSGRPTVEISGWSLFGAIIEPPSDNPETRAKQRVEALFRLLDDLVIDQDGLLELAGGDVGVAAGVQGKRDMEGRVEYRLGLARLRVLQVARALALEKEKAAEAVERNLNVTVDRRKEVTDELEGEAVPDVSSDDLRDSIKGAQEELGALKAAREKRVVREEERARVGDPGPEPNLEIVFEQYRRVQAEIDDLEKRLVGAKARLSELDALGHERRMEHDLWMKRKRVVDEPIEGPEQAEVDGQEKLISDLYIDLSVARFSEELEALEKLRKDQLASVKKLRSEAERFRDVAGGVSTKVNEILQGEQLGDLELDDDLGLVARDHDDVRRGFDDLSLGARVSATYMALAPRCFPAGILPLDPGFWAALDGDSEAQLVKLVAGEELVVGELRPAVVSEYSKVPQGFGDEIQVVTLGSAFLESRLTSAEYVTQQLTDGKKMQEDRKE